MVAMLPAATAAVETARVANMMQNLMVSFAARGWMGNELDVNADILVLANPEIAQLPPWVIGLIAAGGLAAALSTAAGLLLYYLICHQSWLDQT